MIYHRTLPLIGIVLIFLFANTKTFAQEGSPTDQERALLIAQAVLEFSIRDNDSDSNIRKEIYLADLITAIPTAEEDYWMMVNLISQGKPITYLNSELEDYPAEYHEILKPALLKKMQSYHSILRSCQIKEGAEQTDRGFEIPVQCQIPIAKVTQAKADIFSDGSNTPPSIETQIKWMEYLHQVFSSTPTRKFNTIILVRHPKYNYMRPILDHPDYFPLSISMEIIHNRTE